MRDSVDDGRDSTVPGSRVQEFRVREFVFMVQRFRESGPRLRWQFSFGELNVEP
jgi:hypothetical protein